MGFGVGLFGPSSPSMAKIYIPRSVVAGKLIPVKHVSWNIKLRQTQTLNKPEARAPARHAARGPYEVAAVHRDRHASWSLPCTFTGSDLRV